MSLIPVKKKKKIVAFLTPIKLCGCVHCNLSVSGGVRTVTQKLAGDNFKTSGLIKNLKFHCGYSIHTSIYYCSYLILF